jgi:HK97 family phage portal protein
VRWWPFGRKQAINDPLALLLEIYGSRASWAGKRITLNTALRVAAALACGRVIAEGIAMLPWKVYQAQDRLRDPVPKHPLYDKLAVSPNRVQTAFEFQETIGLHLAFCGAAFVWAPTVSGRIDELWPLDPSGVTVKYKFPELPTYDVRLGDGRQFTLSAAEVWHIRGPSWNGYTGLEFMNIAREALGLSMALEEGQAKLQSQGVQMPGYLSADGNLTDEQHKKLTKWLQEKHMGSSNAGNPMVLDRSTKWIETAMSNVDGQVLEQRRFEVEEVCRFMRVLPIMIGHADKTTTYASAEQMFLAHSMYTSGPWARRLEQSADKRLLTPEERAAGYYTNLNEKAMLRMAAKDQMEFLARGVLTGIYSRNEARAKLDENPAEGLDEFLAPANTFLTNPPEAPANDPAPKPTATE